MDKTNIKYLCNVSKGEKKDTCEDSVACEIIELNENEIIWIGALSDGAGSSKYASEASQLATKRFVENVKSVIEDYKLSLSIKNKLHTNILIKSTPLIDQYLLKNIFSIVRNDLKKYSKSKGWKIEEFYATLVGCIYYFNTQTLKSCLVCGSVGDSAVAVISKNKKDIFFPNTNKGISLDGIFYDTDISKFLDKHTINTISSEVIAEIIKGEYINQTVFLTSEQWEDALSISYVENPLGLFISSDGLNNIYFKSTQKGEKEDLPAEDIRHWEWYLQLKDEYILKFYDKLKEEKISDDNLGKLLSSDKLLKINKDDKSIIICAFPETEKYTSIKKDL